MAVKAKEYDKVDIIKKVAELEGRNLSLQKENDKYMQLKQVDDGSIENLRAENKQLMEVLEQNQQEIQILKSNHDSNLD